MDIFDSCENCVHFRAFKEYGTGGMCQEIREIFKIKQEFIISGELSDTYKCSFYLNKIKKEKIESEVADYGTEDHFTQYEEDGA